MLELEVAIAGELHWSHDDIMDLPVGYACHLAMRATRARWQRIDDMRQAAAWSQLPPEHGMVLMRQIDHMLSGPGDVVREHDEWTPAVRAAAKQANDERDAQYNLLAKMGILCRGDGGIPIAAVLRGQA